MTADLSPARRSTLSPFIFAADVEPLPLVDPTTAARLVNLQRHTLACYRHLGGGPAFYKFGRWIRYDRADLARWRNPVRDGSKPSADNWPSDSVSASKVMINQAAAARFLTVSRHWLHANQIADTGPPAQHIRRRIYYAVDELLRWTLQQRRSCEAA